MSDPLDWSAHTKQALISMVCAALYDQNLDAAAELAHAIEVHHHDPFYTKYVARRREVPVVLMVGYPLLF